jgi:hypothetical protein
MKSVHYSDGGGAVECPIHLHDITCVPQSRNNNYIYPFSASYLMFTSPADTASVRWGYRTTPDAASTDIINKDFPQASATVSKEATLYPTYLDNPSYDTSLATHTRDGLPGAKSFLESVNAKFAFYGPQQAPTRIQVQFVQLHQDVSPRLVTKHATAFW